MKRAPVNDGSSPSKKEIESDLMKRFYKAKDGSFLEGWGCTTYEALIRFAKGPSGLDDDTHVREQQQNAYMGRLREAIPRIFRYESFKPEQDPSWILKSISQRRQCLFPTCRLSQEEMKILIDVMHAVFSDGTAEYTSWARMCASR